jgi:hypothetical protein
MRPISLPTPPNSAPLLVLGGIGLKREYWRGVSSRVGEGSRFPIADVWVDSAFIWLSDPAWIANIPNLGTKPPKLGKSGALVRRVLEQSKVWLFRSATVFPAIVGDAT